MPQKQPSYQDLNSELETVLAQLQSGDLDIDEATAAYERGMKLVQQLETYVKEAENKITKVKASFETK
jgi:exodeoxyribonuclease VII small subunit